MKRYARFVTAIIALLLLSVNTVFTINTNASNEVFGDIGGHWAETVLMQAFNDGIIVGDRGFLRPNESASTAQILTIICRVLDAQVSADISYWGLPQNAWYYGDIAKAAHLGLISSSDAKDLLSPMTRQEAFCLLAEAFQLVEAKPDTSVLGKFADAGSIDYTRRQALASLVSQGLIAGNYGKLNVNSNITRAEVVSILYRIIGKRLPAARVSGDYGNPLVIQGSAELSGNKFGKGVWLDCAASDVSLNGIDAVSVTIRSHTLNSLTIGDSARIGKLTLAAQSGDIDISPENGSVVGTLTVGAGNGKVTVSGIDKLEITGNNRSVTISGGAESVIVTGRNNTIRVCDGAQAGKIELLRSATDSRVVIDGQVRELEVIGLGVKVSGGGYAEKLIIPPGQSSIDVDHGAVFDTIDQGIIEASVKISAPDKLPVGNALLATATVENATPGLQCTLTWSVDSVPVMQCGYVTGDKIPELSYKFTYSRDMKAGADVNLSIVYVTMQGERQEIAAAGTVVLENYGKQHWIELEAKNILGKVTTGYKGDFTLEWAQANDLDDIEKEAWIYAKGYTSNTDYLLWVSIAYQRVNIFKKSPAKNWDLIKTCIVGTGAPGRSTSTGVTTVTYRQVNGWTTSSYTAKPVVRFYPRSGYAFHSRLYYPNSDIMKDYSIGFPVSHGCVRMYDEDIWYIYDNVPDGTTVVIY